MRNFILVALAVKLVLSSCPTHFEKVGNLCLFFSHETEMKWAEAEWFCRWNGAKLLFLRDKPSQERIFDFFNLKGIKRSYWAGGYVNPDSKWHWIDHNPSVFNSTTQQLATNEFAYLNNIEKDSHFDISGWIYQNVFVLRCLLVQEISSFHQ